MISEKFSSSVKRSLVVFALFSSLGKHSLAGKMRLL